jgi:hypothetical protein
MMYEMKNPCSPHAQRNKLSFAITAVLFSLNYHLVAENGTFMA